MKRFLTIISLIAAACFSASAEGLDGIVPAPAHAELLKGNFHIKGAPVKCDPAIGDRSVEAVRYFISHLALVSGKSLTVSTPLGLKSAVDNGSAKGFIFVPGTEMGPEEYSIDIDSKRVLVQAGGDNGFLYALQTLKQLMPVAIYGNAIAADSEKWTLPCCAISDKPRFAYRGMHLDSARHFWSVKEVKKYLDVMAMFKLNRFHWHLTDDQGWRIEIKAYPLLSQIGSSREGTMIGRDFSSNDHIRYGGFYTQDEIREVVEYADRLGITVIPEIDLPGHMLAAMSAYPWLGCSGGPYAAWTKWGVSDQVLCVGKETTFEFLEKVLGEIAELFPSEYIHIGGDECPKTEWEKCPECQALIARLGLKDDDRFTKEQYLQNYVTARIQDFLAGKGRRIIGWDEILEGELAPGATVMSWRGSAGGKEAAARGFDAIMAPNSHCYFDYCQSENQEEEPLGIGGFVSLERIYSLEPCEGISEKDSEHIIGVQANLWTEYIATEEHLEYMLLPRLLALSEVQWCQPGNKDFTRFKAALEAHEFPILEKTGYNYRKKL